jgi:hypothetical protein
MLHATYMQGNRGDSWLLVVGSQIAYLTFGLSFDYNLCVKCPNGSCEPILDMYVPRSFQWYKELLHPMGFDPCNHFLKIWESTEIIATLTLGSRPRRGFARLLAKRGSSRVKDSVKEWTLTLPKELPPWELESRWTPECSESDCKGQNSMDWGFLYTIEKKLKLKCLKWARMNHLNT